MAKAEARGAYLRAVLALDPVTEAGRIMELRRDQRQAGPDPAPAPASPRRARRTRESAEQVLRQTSKEFWDEEAAPLAALQSLDLTEHPDLARHLKRLTLVGNLRDDVLDASALNGMDPHFLDAYQRILVAPESERVELRRRTLAAMGATRLRKKALHSVRLLRKHLPEVYDLEADWLDDVRRAKRYLKEAGPIGGTLGFFGVYFLIRGVYALYKWFVREA